MIQHYTGFIEGKRTYRYHKISYETFELLQVNASKNMQVNIPKTGPESNFEWTGGDLNPRPPECKSGVHTN